ncbi:MAG: hypothetical protein VR72_08395 [Clostridiaceae bacterium BRH_c20a]|nr:MAG: hypothetical protein VR72_08395 [Clostridiaceae bacterium BRH_c20a]
MKKLIINAVAQCVGCRQCELICSLIKEKGFAPWLARIQVKRDEEIVLAEPIICQQCIDAPCAAVCPVDAIVKSETTEVLHVDQIECIGCMQCVEACPYGAMVFDAQKGKVFKCDMCWGEPACISVCPANVLGIEEVN